MTGNKRLKILMLGAVAGAAFVPAYAAAQDAQSERLQRQIDTLQQQLQGLQKQVSETKKATQQQAAQAAAAAPMAGAYAQAPAGGGAPMPGKAPWALPAGVKITWGGFIAAESVYRTRNEVADIGSSFTGIPYPFSPQFNEGEFHGSARQSRISLLAEGTIDPVQKLAAYYEMDFLGAGATSNYNESNSWAPRLRHGYFTYDNMDWGFHFLAGQAWSLLTQNTVGITPRKENIPLTIDASYVVGFDYTRNWQIRLVKDFGPMFSLGVSVENPAQSVYSSTGAVANNGTFNGLVVNFNNPGGSFLGSSGFANTFTTDTAPDIIEKAAFDPGFGHYEVFGVQRFFTDNVFACTTAPVATGICPLTAGDLGSASSKTTYGEGIGGSVLLPIIPKFLDFTASTLYGKGIGRYGAGQLNDVFVGSDGSLKPITAIHALAGLVAHPWAGLDVYAYGGIEKAQGNFFTATNGAVTGFGVPTANNLPCGITSALSFSGGASGCAAINKTLSDVTVGFWQNLYQGQYGRVAAGLEYEYIVRKSFDTNPGLGGVVSTNDNIFMSSIRYYPF